MRYFLLMSYRSYIEASDGLRTCQGDLSTVVSLVAELFKVYC